jgi:putative component of membrane protein insertase Oxa1/YidC/SpoIIIJ protein YidD
MFLNRFFIILFFLICIFFSGFAQDLNAAMARVSLTGTHEQVVETKRDFLRSKKGFRPFYYVGASFLFLYQNIFSEQIQASCVYQTSCSEFAKQNIQQKGFVKGLLLGFNQLSECHHGAVYEHPPVFINSDKKIINRTGNADH